MAKTKKDETPEENSLTAEIVEDVQEVVPLDELDAALNAEKDKYLRLAAEYDNYRKRNIKEREAIYSDIRADTIAQFLPVFDNLARALGQECSDEAFYKASR